MRLIAQVPKSENPVTYFSTYCCYVYFYEMCNQASWNLPELWTYTWKCDLEAVAYPRFLVGKTKVGVQESACNNMQVKHNFVTPIQKKIEEQKRGSIFEP